MEPARRIENFWAWLPAFRAVAEREHVGQAAEALGISPSAVSRTVSLLEEDLGLELLRRHGRGVRLTEQGRVLLGASRDAMRIVDEALRRFSNPGLTGVVRIATTDPLTELVLQPALPVVARDHRELGVELSALQNDQVATALRRGAIDLALLRAPVRADELQVARIGEAKLGVYSPTSCGRESPMRRPFEQLTDRPFVAASGPHGEDNWPLSVPRRVIARAATFREAADLAEALGASVVLPQVLGERAVQRGRLQLVPSESLRPLQLVAVWRTPVSLLTPADAVMAAIRAHFARDAARE